MLTSLSATGFKAWKQIDDMRLGSITGLFGTNSSGKTSILQLLLMLRQTTESSDRSLVLDLGGERSLVQLGSYKDVVFRHDTLHEFSFRLDWTLPKELEVEDPAQGRRKTLFRSDRMAIACSLRGKEDNPFVESVTYELGENSFTMHQGTKPSEYKLETESSSFAFKRTPGRVWPLPAPAKCYGFPDQVFSYFQNASFLGDLQLEFEQLFSRLFYLGPLREFPKRFYPWAGTEPADMGQRGERAIDALLAARSRGRYISPGYRRRKRTLDEQVAHWLKELGLIHSFTVNRIAEGNNLYEVRVRKTAASSEVLVTDVGFGVSQILPVLVLCYYVPEGSIVILEQPEIHLHPSVQSGLADVFIDAMQNRGVQIILESHSEHLLRRLQRRIAEEVIDSKDVALYFCDMDSGHPRLSELALDLFGNISNWPKDFFGDEFGEMAAMTEAALKRQVVRAE